MTISTSISGQLTELAYKLTDNFCYGCYRVVEGEFCPECHSDDFMRHMDGVGVEYGTDWVVDEIVKEHLEPVDENELFDEMMDCCYPDIEIGCSSWTASHVLKNLDPIAYRIGTSEYMQDLVEDEQYLEIDGGYYAVSDIEEMIETLG